MSVVRRRHVRVPLDGNVPVFVFAGAEERLRCRARDVSMSGLRLEGKGSPVGTRLYLEYALPHHRDYPVMAIAKVVWTGASAFGVEILRFFPSARFAVRSFVDRHRRRKMNYNLFDEA